MHWESYQAKLLAKLKAIREGVSIAGDGRHDSMGHSAKCGAHTMFCCNIPMIIHFVVIQVQYIFAIGHVRYINIQAWLRGFRVKIANFSSFFCLSIPTGDLDTKKTTPNIDVRPESLGPMLEY